eukprot:CAMPEP_0185039940 /NCGR_PEP_ID=MMETSP1103-20130426/37396_1 /TAXON_ID=36769 /ORGANISM="Paraphysomonas bandaiensis, Strain Caron Lab Isolate" /LENGTH=924 /DNA_ID=CAMNT_0027579029 /DNA_START=1 /DNA_END=2775 /DNA_ORIENTATION=+
MSLLLQSPVKYEDAYERQGESIIMWREHCPVTIKDIDYALSFQDPAGCDAIWEGIRDAQTTRCPVSTTVCHDSSDIDYSPSTLENDLVSSYIGLPEVCASNLEEIKDKLSSAFPSQKEVYASIVLDQSGRYLKKLLDLNVELDRSGNTTACRRIAEIIRGMVCLNDTQVIDLILSDDIFPKVAGALEYDPLLQCKASYRADVERLPAGPRCVIGEAFGSSYISGLVLQLHRMKLLKDVMIRPHLDETGAMAMNSMLHNLQATVCTEVFKDTNYLGKVLQHIEDWGSDAKCSKHAICREGDDTHRCGGFGGNDLETDSDRFEKAKGCLGLLRELFFMSRYVSIDSRSNLYIELLTKLRVPLFSAVSRTLCQRRGVKPSALAKMRLMAAEILASIALVCPAYIRQSILEDPIPQPPAYTTKPQTTPCGLADVPPAYKVDMTRAHRHYNDTCILFIIIERIVCDEETAVVEHLGDVLKSLLDPEKMDKDHKERFMALFYGYYIQWMLVPFVDEDRLPDEGIDICPPALKGPLVTDDVNIVNSVKYFQSLQDISSISSSRRFLCEIFSLCVGGHVYRMKCFISRNSALSRVLRLLQSRYKHMHVFALKFARAVIAIKDEFYYKHIVKFDILKPVFKLFSSIFSRDNLVTSSIIELIDFICVERIYMLVSYVVEKHTSDFLLCEGDESKDACGGPRYGEYNARGGLHSEIFEKLLSTYKEIESLNISAPKNQHRAVSSCGSNSSISFGDPSQMKRLQQNREFAELESEEAYFYENDSDSESEEPIVGPSSLSGGREYIGRAQGHGCYTSSGVVSSIAKHKSSLSLLCEMYDDDFDEGDNGHTPTDECTASSSSFEAENRCTSPDLPPLMPKFETGEEDIDGNIFTRKVLHQEVASTNGSTKANVSPMVTKQKPSTGTVSFSMKKKQKIL